MGVLALVSIVIGMAGGQLSETSETVVPFELVGGRIYVQAYVNDSGPFRFAVDTGASGEGRADTRLAQRLHLEPAGTVANSDGVAVTRTDLVSVRSIRFGSIERRDVALPSRDYNRNLKSGAEPLMGIIGREFFAGTLLTIDYPERVIRIADGVLDPKAAGVVKYEDGLAIPVCFGTVCAIGKVDTGSNRAIVAPRVLAEKVAAGPPTPLGQVGRMNSSASLYEVAVRDPVRVGALATKTSKILYAEPSPPTVNIGSDFLKDYVLTIDGRNQLLRISPPADPRSPKPRQPGTVPSPNSAP